MLLPQVLYTFSDAPLRSFLGLALAMINIGIKKLLQAASTNMGFGQFLLLWDRREDSATERRVAFAPQVGEQG